MDYLRHKEEQIQTKERRRKGIIKIRAEIKEAEYRKTMSKMNKPSQLFKNK